MTFKCNGNYIKEYKEFTNLVLTRYGKSAQATDRETMYLASKGNLVAQKEYADLIFYNKIIVSNRFDTAFNLYLKAADITMDNNGLPVCGEGGNPQAFAMLGYYFYNYKRSGFLKNCEDINALIAFNDSSLYSRIRYALIFSVSCLQYEKIPSAINLIGRILDEASTDKELFDFLCSDIKELIEESDFKDTKSFPGSISNQDDCADASNYFYEAAAKEGYAYACNNLASREADIIAALCLKMIEEGVSEFDVTHNIGSEISEHIDKYTDYLKMSAARFESYASNKLGLFYACGEIKSSKYDKTFNFREYSNSSLAKDYFINATVYPCKSSAWAYYNLIKRYPKDYNSNIDLLNEHMECIKRLDPQVYDLAMED